MALAARLVPSTARRLTRRLLSAPAVAPAETATSSIYNPPEEHAALRAMTRQFSEEEVDPQRAAFDAARGRAEFGDGERGAPGH